MPLQNIWPLRFNRGNDYDPEQIAEILKLIEQWGNGIPNAVEPVASVLPTTGLYEGRLIYLQSTKILYMYDGAAAAWVAVSYFGAPTVGSDSIFQPLSLSHSVLRSDYTLEGSTCTYNFNLIGVAAGTAGQILQVGLPFAVVGFSDPTNVIGSVMIFDAGAGIRHNLLTEVGSTASRVQFTADNAAGLWTASFTTNWIIRGQVRFRYR